MVIIMVAVAASVAPAVTAQISNKHTYVQLFHAVYLTNGGLVG